MKNRTQNWIPDSICVWNWNCFSFLELEVLHKSKEPTNTLLSSINTGRKDLTNLVWAEHNTHVKCAPTRIRTWGNTNLVPILYESQHQVSACFTQEPKICVGLNTKDQTAMKEFFFLSTQKQEANNTQDSYQLSTLVARTLPIWYELRRYHCQPYYTYTNLIRTSGNTNLVPILYESQ